MTYPEEQGFKIDPKTGVLKGIRWMPSPHFDNRPLHTTVDLLVVHSVSLPKGVYGTAYIDDLFCGTLNLKAHPSFAQLEGLKVSAHLYIKRDGTITQYVSFFKRAWHAGESCYQGRTACNDFSIGIELEGTDDTPFEQAQYQALKDIVRAIIQLFPAITRDRIVGHSDIAPGRKTDPGSGFDWDFFRD